MTSRLPHPPSVRVATALFRGMHRLLPERYRRTHGREAEALFCDLAGRAHVRGKGPGVLAAFLRAAVDLLGRVPVEHLHARANRSGRLLMAHSARRRWWRERVVRACDSLALDLRYALRSMRRNPTFALGVVLTLALGIGANTAMFSIVNGVLLRPLPYPDPDNLVTLTPVYRTGKWDPYVSYPDLLDWRERSGVFERAVATGSGGGAVTLTGDGEPVQLSVMRVSDGFFQLFGIAPALGRVFVPEDDRGDALRVTILSYALWQGRFGGDPHVVGTTLQLNGRAHVVVGVGPSRFAHGLPGVGDPALWLPMRLAGLPPDSLPNRGAHSFHAYARLASGVTIAQAHDRLDPVSEELERLYPDSNTGKRLRLRRIHDLAVQDARVALTVFLGAVGFVLAIAVANVMSLLLARTADRGREIALRTAIGAGRDRIVRQLFTESLAWATLGGGLGLGLAVLMTRFVVWLAGGSIPLASTVSVDLRVLSVTAATVVGTGIVTGVVTGRHAIKPDLHTSLQGDGGSRGATQGHRRTRFRQGLVVVEVASTLLLLVGAGLLVRSFWNLSRVDPGFEPGIVTFRVRPPYEDIEQIVRFYDRLLERVGAIPGVARAASVHALPLSGRQTCGTLAAQDDPTRFEGEDMCAEVRAIAPGYFWVMGIPLLRGRGFLRSDDGDAPDVVIINESTAELLWPGQDPLGKRLTTGLGGRTHEVVGVVADVKQFGLGETTPPQTYLPDHQWRLRARNIVLRAGVPAATLLPALRKAVWDLDPDLPVTELGTLADNVDRTVAGPRFRTWLLVGFSGIAFLLAVVGIYGVISYSVAQRHREMAIRLSLGAPRIRVLRLVLGEGLRPVMAGIALGLVGALSLTRFLSSLLFDVSTTDPAAFALVGFTLVAVSLGAIYLPARKATRVDPMGALRDS